MVPVGFGFCLEEHVEPEKEAVHRKGRLGARPEKMTFDGQSSARPAPAGSEICLLSELFARHVQALRLVEMRAFEV